MIMTLLLYKEVEGRWHISKDILEIDRIKDFHELFTYSESIIC
jgi:hypothetical protein